MANLFKLFQSIFPEKPLQVGVVISSAPGDTKIRLADGSVIMARGSAQLASSVFVRDGVIEGTAPQLLAQVVDV